MSNTNLYLQSLLEANPLQEPLLRSVIQALQLPRGCRGLDIGCGIGLQELLLAEAVGPEGQITGLDIDPELLAFGESLVAQAGLSARVTFHAGDMRFLPFAEGSFAWVWSADCIGYPAGDFSPLLKELVRVVEPGGSIILLAWSSQQVLPGYSLLEARLNATCSGYQPFLQGKKPDDHFLRALHWFKETGLEEIEAQTFAGDVRAPLDQGQRIALTSLFEMLWGTKTSEVSPEDWREYLRLCQPSSADFILDQPGYYAFFTCSLFRGKVPYKKYHIYRRTT